MLRILVVQHNVRNTEVHSSEKWLSYKPKWIATAFKWKWRKFDIVGRTQRWKVQVRVTPRFAYCTCLLPPTLTLQARQLEKILADSAAHTSISVRIADSRNRYAWNVCKLQLWQHVTDCVHWNRKIQDWVIAQRTKTRMQRSVNEIMSEQENMRVARP